MASFGPRGRQDGDAVPSAEDEMIEAGTGQMIIGYLDLLPFHRGPHYVKVINMERGFVIYVELDAMNAPRTGKSNVYSGDYLFTPGDWISNK